MFESGDQGEGVRSGFRHLTTGYMAVAGLSAPMIGYHRTTLNPKPPEAPSPKPCVSWIIREVVCTPPLLLSLIGFLPPLDRMSISPLLSPTRPPF